MVKKDNHMPHILQVFSTRLLLADEALLLALIFLMLKPDGTKVLGKLFSMSQMNRSSDFQESTSVGITSSSLIIDISRPMNI